MYGVFEELATGHSRKKIEGQSDKALSAALEAEVFKNLSRQEQDEFYGTCRKLKIDKYDTELFRIMSMFQYQKRCLDELPAEIEKYKREIAEHSAEIIRLTEEATDSANAIEKHLETIKEFDVLSASPIAKVTEMKKVAEEVVEKTAENLHKVMRTSLKEMGEEAEETMQSVRDNVYAHLDNIVANVHETFESDLQNSLRINMDKVNQIIAEGAGARMRTAEEINADTQALKADIDTIRTLRKEYRAEIRAIKFWNWRWCSAAMLAIVLCSWVFFHLNYRTRLHNMQDVVVRQVGENQAVLTTLARENRRLELSTRENGNRMLFIRNAEGWTTVEKHGVIEFK